MLISNYNMDGKAEMTDTCLDSLIIVLVELMVLITNDENVKRSIKADASVYLGKWMFLNLDYDRIVRGYVNKFHFNKKISNIFRNLNQNKINDNEILARIHQMLSNLDHLKLN